MGLERYNFDIDKYVNPIIPAPPLHRLPVWINRWFGYRESPPPPVPDVLRYISILVGSFVSIIVMTCTFKFSPFFQNKGVPDIIPSWGASVILCFNAIEAPLAQPRNVFFGTFLSALVGVCITKLFDTSSAGETSLWIAGALSVGVASVVMEMTKTVHPPAGAVALLAAVDDQIRALGWYFLPVQLLSGVIIIGVACIMNNLVRRYPVYWWTPAKLSKEPAKDQGHSQQTHPSSSHSHSSVPNVAEKIDEAYPEDDPSSIAVLEQTLSSNSSILSPDLERSVVILEKDFSCPIMLKLTDEEQHVLARIQQKLRTLGNNDMV